jgi:peptidoglycan/LPS O-acetylase OafA/YrhL
MGHGYRPQLDGVRAFCIIFTIFNHVPGAPSYINGSIGVDVFFALSGWLITWLLMVEYEETQTVVLGEFYIRRAFRILPLYAVFLAIYVLLSYSGIKVGSAKQMTVAFPYLATLNSEYRPPESGTLFGHAWTLGIEEKFYLVWPMILALTIQRPAKTFLYALAAVGLLLLTFGVSLNIIRGYFGLGIGATMATLVRRHPRIEKMLRERSIAGILMTAMGAAYVGSITFPLSVAWNASMALLAAPTIASLWFRGGQPVGRFLSKRFLAWVGRLTYAIYLVQTLAINMAVVLLRRAHLPPGPWSTFAVGYAISILIAWGLHWTVEKPLIRLGKRFITKRRENALHQPA